MHCAVVCILQEAILLMHPDKGIPSRLQTSPASRLISELEEEESPTSRRTQPTKHKPAHGLACYPPSPHPHPHKQWIQAKRTKTYNTRDSLVVTDPTTDLALTSLTRGERTGSRIFLWIWSYVIEWAGHRALGRGWAVWGRRRSGFHVGIYTPEADNTNPDVVVNKLVLK